MYYFCVFTALYAYTICVPSIVEHVKVCFLSKAIIYYLGLCPRPWGFSHSDCQKRRKEGIYRKEVIHMATKFKGKSKRIATQEVTSITSDPRTGEITQTISKTHVFTKDSEDSFIKFYYANALAVQGFFDGNREVSFLMVLSKYLVYTSDSTEDLAIFTASKYTKRQIAATLKCSESSVEKTIKNLCNLDVLKKLDRATYAISPYIIAKGGWSTVKKMRQSFDVCTKNKSQAADGSVSTEFEVEVKREVTTEPDGHQISLFEDAASNDSDKTE